MEHIQYDELFENNKKWVKEKLNSDPQYFETLSKGQCPKYLIIGCSDSRLPLTSLLKANPGDIFIHRNIGNLVGITDINLLSVLEYSIEHLNIEHIIVAGHYSCGGVEAAVDGVDQGLIENWVSPIKDLYVENKKELDCMTNKDMKDKLSEISAIAQVKNIFKTPVMKRALKSESYPEIHAWIFNIYNGKILELPLPLKEWKEIGLIPEFY